MRNQLLNWVIDEVYRQAKALNLQLDEEQCFKIAQSIIKSNFPNCCKHYLEAHSERLSLME